MMSTMQMKGCTTVQCTIMHCRLLRLRVAAAECRCDTHAETDLRQTRRQAKSLGVPHLGETSTARHHLGLEGWLAQRGELVGPARPCPSSLSTLFPGPSASLSFLRDPLDPGSIPS